MTIADELLPREEHGGDFASEISSEVQAAALHEAIYGLRIRHPQWSASVTISRGQKTTLIIFLALVLASFPLAGPTLAVSLIIAFLSIIYLWAMVERGATSIRGLRTPVAKAPLEKVAEKDLPKYTILVPAYDEPQVMPQLVRGLGALNYPVDKLEIFLLLEADDSATISAARAQNLGPQFHILLVPAAEPRTKPKACNYGLQFATGEFVTIYDAEDRPDIEQLRLSVATFSQADENLICLQARLSYFNQSQNLLTRWFAIEYLIWFAILLPGLMSLKLPIPLGGTSNHFRTKVLQELGAWDPYNVTEDADLGIRIFMAGYSTAVLDSVTWEEATSDAINWIRQRSRWYKGYLQTWLVHMRSPRTTWKVLGPRGFISVTALIAGTPILAIINYLTWTLSAIFIIALPDWARALFPPVTAFMAITAYALGNAIAYYVTILGLRTVKGKGLTFAALIYPLYWVLMAVAAVKAMAQLITRPSYWEKTVHGFGESDGA